MKFKKICLFLIAFILVERFCYLQTGSFAVGKMRDNQAPSFPTDLQGVELKQPLVFLGAGKQFYAFETADHNYVVKFMKWSRKRPLPWLETMKTPFDACKTSYLLKRKRARDLVIQSTQIAHDLLNEETHVHKAKPISSWHLIDKLGIYHTVDSCKTFVSVQEKADDFPQYFLTHEAERTSLLASFIDTVASQCLKGVVNTDPRAYRNFGVINHKVIIIDIGSFQHTLNVENFVEVIREITQELSSLRLWLSLNAPSSLADFDYLLLQKMEMLKNKRD
ncbi:MAG: hypothetical protein QRY72_05755 [Candidatus Rhabdochlamydia sp.]